MKKMTLTILILIFITGLTWSQEQAVKKLSVTIGNPWFGLKYDINSRFSAELRDVVDPDLNIPAVKGYYNFYKGSKLTGFTGVGYGIISFKSEDVTGNGSLLTVFVGSEYKLMPNKSLSLDIGYSTINLKSSNYSVSGPEYIFNIGLNCYVF